MRFIKAKSEWESVSTNNDSFSRFHTHVCLAHSCQQFRLFAVGHVRWIDRSHKSCVTSLIPGSTFLQCQPGCWWQIKPEIQYVGSKRKDELKRRSRKATGVWKAAGQRHTRHFQKTLSPFTIIWSSKSLLIGAVAEMGIYAALICVICTCETQTCDRIPQSKIKLPLQNIQKAHFVETETETSTVIA